MEEVVAKRHNFAGAGYIFTIILGLLFIVVGSIVGVQTEQAGAIYVCVVIGCVFLVMGIYYLVRFFMIPANAIVYKDGVLYLPGKVTCRPEEIQKVFVKVYKGRYGAVSKYGKMELTVNGRVYKYNNIAQVKNAQERLLELNKQAIEELNARNREVKPEEDVFSNNN